MTNDAGARAEGAETPRAVSRPEEARAIFEGVEPHARFQAHGSLERYAKFYGENLGAEIGASARARRWGP